MSIETIISNPQASLLYHPESGIVHLEFRQFVFGSQFQTVLMTGIDVMRERGACKWLSDDRGNTSLSKDDQDWSQDVWAPAAKAAGFKYWAVVMPANIIGHMNSEKWAAMSRSDGFTAKLFSDPEVAMAWLEAQGEPPAADSADSSTPQENS
jgi:hypothetical protein